MEAGAVRRLQKQLRHAVRHGAPPRETHHLHVQLASRLMGLERSAEAEPVLQEALDLLPPGSFEHAQVHRLLGDLCREVNPAQASAHYQQELELAMQHNNVQEIQRAHTNLGNVIYQQATAETKVSTKREALKLALYHHDQSLRWAAEVKQSFRSEYHDMSARALMNKANCSFELGAGCLRNAIRFYARAYEHARHVNHYDLMTDIVLNHTDALVACFEVDEALLLLQNHLALSADADSESIAQARNKQALVHALFGHIEQAYETAKGLHLWLRAGQNKTPVVADTRSQKNRLLRCLKHARRVLARVQRLEALAEEKPEEAHRFLERAADALEACEPAQHARAASFYQRAYRALAAMPNVSKQDPGARRRRALISSYALCCQDVGHFDDAFGAFVTEAQLAQDHGLEKAVGRSLLAALQTLERAAALRAWPGDAPASWPRFLTIARQINWTAGRRKTLHRLLKRLTLNTASEAPGDSVTTEGGALGVPPTPWNELGLIGVQSAAVALVKHWLHIASRSSSQATPTRVSHEDSSGASVQEVVTDVLSNKDVTSQVEDEDEAGDDDDDDDDDDENDDRAMSLGDLSDELSMSSAPDDGLSGVSVTEDETRSSHATTHVDQRNVSKRTVRLVKTRNELGETPLQRAAYEGDADKVSLLLAAGAPVDVVDNNGWTPLHDAVNGQHLEVVKILLLQPDIKVNKPGGQQEQKTPLLEAVETGHREIIDALLERGADPMSKAADGRCALSVAADAEDDELYAHLRQHAMALHENLDLARTVTAFAEQAQNQLHEQEMTRRRSEGVSTTESRSPSVRRRSRRTRHAAIDELQRSRAAHRDVTLANIALAHVPDAILGYANPLRAQGVRPARFGAEALYDESEGEELQETVAHGSHEDSGEESSRAEDSEAFIVESDGSRGHHQRRSKPRRSAPPSRASAHARDLGAAYVSSDDSFDEKVNTGAADSARQPSRARLQRTHGLKDRYRPVRSPNVEPGVSKDRQHPVDVPTLRSAPDLDLFSDDDSVVAAQPADSDDAEYDDIVVDLRDWDASSPPPAPSMTRTSSRRLRRLNQAELTSFYPREDALPSSGIVGRAASSGAGRALSSSTPDVDLAPMATALSTTEVWAARPPGPPMLVQEVAVLDTFDRLTVTVTDVKTLDSFKKAVSDAYVRDFAVLPTVTRVIQDEETIMSWSSFRLDAPCAVHLVLPDSPSSLLLDRAEQIGLDVASLQQVGSGLIVSPSLASEQTSLLARLLRFETPLHTLDLTGVWLRKHMGHLINTMWCLPRLERLSLAACGLEVEDVHTLLSMRNPVASHGCALPLLQQLDLRYNALSGLSPAKLGLFVNLRPQLRRVLLNGTGLPLAFTDSVKEIWALCKGDFENIQLEGLQDNLAESPARVSADADGKYTVDLIGLDITASDLVALLHALADCDFATSVAEPAPPRLAVRAELNGQLAVDDPALLEAIDGYGKSLERLCVIGSAGATDATRRLALQAAWQRHHVNETGLIFQTQAQTHLGSKVATSSQELAWLMDGALDALDTDSD